MSEVIKKLGKVSIVPRGEWSEGQTYYRLDLVTCENDIYIAKTGEDGFTGKKPTSSANYWVKCTNISSLQSQIDQILGSGVEISEEAELYGIRTGIDGTLYDSAGEAVREQVNDRKKVSDKHQVLIDDLNQIIYKDSYYNSIDDYLNDYPITLEAGSMTETAGSQDTHNSNSYYKNSVRNSHKSKIFLRAGSTIDVNDGYEFQICRFTENDNTTFVEIKKFPTTGAYIVPEDSWIRISVKEKDADINIEVPEEERLTVWQNLNIKWKTSTINQVGNNQLQVNNIINAIGIEPIEMDNGYITTVTTNNAPVNISSITLFKDWRHAIVDCSVGDVFTITANGGIAPRAYCFIDVNGNVLQNAASNANLINVVLTAPNEAAKLIINDKGGNVSYYGDYNDYNIKNISTNTGIATKNKDDLLTLDNFSINTGGITIRAISDKNILLINGVAPQVFRINCLTGEYTTTSDNAVSKWGNDTIPWLELNNSYKLTWRLISGSYTYNANPAFTVKDANGVTLLKNADGVTKLTSVPSFIQFYIPKDGVFDNCVYEVSIVKIDVDEVYKQSSASMMLSEGVKVPTLNALIDDLSYTIPAEVAYTEYFVDENGYAEGGCTDGNDTLYYVKHGTDYGSGGNISDDRSTRTYVKASIDGTKIVSREVTGEGDGDGVHYIHSNGMCYNPTTNEVLVIPLDPTGNNAVHFLDGDTLVYKRTINFGDSLKKYAPNMKYFTGVAWDSTKEMYVFLMAGESSHVDFNKKRLRGFAFYDKNFNFIKATYFDRLLAIPGYNNFNVSSTTFGGVYTDANYIYTTVHISNSENIEDTSDFVAIFDWDGLYINSFKAAFGNELEWMGRLNDGTWVFGYGRTVSGVTRVTVYKAVTIKYKQVLKDTVRSQFKPYQQEDIDTTDKINGYYFQNNYLAERIAKITANTKSMSMYGDSFIWLTDPHYYNLTTGAVQNTMQSTPLINYISQRTNINKFFFGGDYENVNTTTPEDAIVLMQKIRAEQSSIWDKTFAIIGNHEWNNPNATSDQEQYQLTAQEIYQLFIKDKEAQLGAIQSQPGAQSYPVNSYGSYWMDNPIQKIRYFFLACNRGATISTDTIQWFSQQMNEVPSGYTVVVLSHTIFGAELEDQPGQRPLAGRFNYIAQIMDAANHSGEPSGSITINNTTFSYDYTNLDIVVACAIGGHIHADYTDVTPGNIPLIATTCDRAALSSLQSELTKTLRAANTIAEQAFDVVQIDTLARKIYMTRIGGSTIGAELVEGTNKVVDMNGDSTQYNVTEWTVYSPYKDREYTY